MKQKLLKLTLLLCALIVGGATWAQSDYSTDYTGNVTLLTSGGTSTTACTISINNEGYAGIKAGTSKVAGAVKITVPSGTKYLHLHAAAWNNENVSLAVTPSGYSENISLTYDDKVSGQGTTYVLTNSNASTSYYKVITFASALAENTDLTFTATGGKRFVIWGVTAEEEGGGESVATTTTIDATDITNTDVYVGTEAGSLAATVTTTEGAVIDGATVTWSGNNDRVATIDEATGAVTLVAAGTVTFTASYTGVQGEYKASSATYEMTVTSSAPYVQPTQFDIALNNSTFGCITGNNGKEQTLTQNKTTVVAGCTSSASSKTYYDASHVRFYADSYLKITAPEGYNITSIVFTSDGTWNGSITVDTGSYDNNKKTWTGESNSVEFSFAAQNRISSVAITLEANVPQVLSSIALSGEYPTTFHQGDDFSHEGMTVTATYESGKTADVTEDVTFSGYDMNVVGEQTVTVSYTENEVTKTATYSITVNAPATLTGIALSGTYPTEFQQGEAFSSEGIVVTANYDDNTSADVTKEARFSGYDMDALGEQTVTVSYSEGEVTKSATYTITVVEKKGTSDNPYSVAEAIEATPASGTSSEVYIQGIVSELFKTSIIDDGNNYRYYISDDGTTENQLLVFRGKGLNNVAFSSADDLKIGDEVVIYGSLTIYNDAPEVASGNYIVSLNRPVTPSIAVSTTTVEATAEGAEGTITVTYNNITDVMAEVQFCDAEGNKATYEWITAVINSKNNNVDYLIEENTSTEARTAYMKVYALDDETNAVYSELITVTQAGVVVDYATLPFEFDGGLADIKNTNGLSQDDLGSDYKSSPYLKFNDTGDCLILKINERPGKLTFDIKGNSFSDGTFTVQTSEDGETYTDLKKYKEFGSSLRESFNGLGENVRYIKWIYTEKVDGNVALGNIKLDKYYEPIPLTLNASGFATFASTEALDFSDFETAGYTAWQATSTDGETIQFKQIKTAVAAGTGILLSGEAGAAIELNAASEGEDLTGTNLLVGFTVATEVADDEYFGLSGDKFVKVKAGTIPAGKALLPASVGTSVKSFSFAFEGNATGIKSLSDSPLQGETIVNLAGQRLQKMQKGINIVNGKKVLY